MRSYICITRIWSHMSAVKESLGSLRPRRVREKIIIGNITISVNILLSLHVGLQNKQNAAKDAVCTIFMPIILATWEGEMFHWWFVSTASVTFSQWNYTPRLFDQLGRKYPHSTLRNKDLLSPEWWGWSVFDGRPWQPQQCIQALPNAPGTIFVPIRIQCLTNM